jgi:DNA-binding transcriptional ArsR family regulator
MRRDYERRLPADWRDVAQVFTALGDEHRQRILLLFERGEELTITQIVDAAPLARTSIVHHLKALEAAGVLARRKAGREVFYRIESGRLIQALQRVLHYIEGNL